MAAVPMPPTKGKAKARPAPKAAPASRPATTTTAASAATTTWPSQCRVLQETRCNNGRYKGNGNP